MRINKLRKHRQGDIDRFPIIRRNHTLRPDNILSIKRCVAQRFRKLDDIIIRFFSAQRSTGENMENICRVADSCFKPLQQQGRFHSRRSPIDMCFIKDKKTQFCSGKDQVILGPEHHILKHSIVRHEDVRRRLLHLIARNDLIFQRLQGMSICILVHLAVLSDSVLFILLRTAVVYAESNLRIALQQIAQSFHLVVGKSIHRINQNRSHAG